MPDPTPVQLIAGLGNPGSEYTETRHNVGFWFVDRIARDAGAVFRNESRFLGEVCTVGVGSEAVRLLKPSTFMNHSGQSVGALARFFRVPVEAILLVHDDLDLSPGTVRLKRGGGHGGHNGLRDSIAHLGSKEFARLRIGIGHPGNQAAVTSYVLGRPGQPDRELLEIAIAEAVDEWPGIVRGDFQTVMGRLHSR